MLYLLLVCTTGCATSRLNRQITRSPVFEEACTGFALYDPAADRMLTVHQSDECFKPASNVKIVTPYAARRTFPNDSLHALRYRRAGNTLTFTGTEHPTLLLNVHPKYEIKRAERLDWAKTGTLSNNYCLGGYVRTCRGRWLIFSFVHNHYVRPVDDYEREMERVMRYVWERL
ncbi:MAG: D-alanyl-D-alanine carboxypeptidase [Catalinimonas sp.]